MPRRLLLAVCALALTPAFFACGDDDGGTGITGGTTKGPSQTPAVVSTASPKLSAPVSQYSVSIDDLGANWITDIKGTVVIDAAGYAKTPRLFSSEADGMKLLKEWGYDGGYETAYSPEGRDQAVLNGAYYVSVESHLFNDEAGAQKAFDYFSQFVSKTPGAQPVSIQPIGNKSIAFVTTTGTITGSNVKATYHQVVFRRGNLITIALTKGAETFMKSDAAWEVAHMADEKAL
ncbi:MAG: hypothetical protein ABI577_13600, partial [bacterium]